jgi:hypothetical protein
MKRILKKNHKAWQLALKLSRRKYNSFIPVKIIDDNTVVLKFYNYGNTHKYTYSDLKLLS